MRALWIATFLLTGCGSVCTRTSVDICNKCPTNDAQKVECKCLANGTLTKADAPDGMFATDQDAADACTYELVQLQYASDDDQASCRANDVYLKKIGVNACTDLGFTGK